MNTIEIKIIDIRIKKIFSLPTYTTIGSSGLDLRACVEKKTRLKSQKTLLVSTGIAIHISNPYITALILPRSGLGHKKGIVLGNLVGLIDSDFQGPLMISLWNRSMEDFYIFPGDRVAQIVFVPIIRPSFTVVDDFDKSTRFDQGFGHSGI